MKQGTGRAPGWAWTNYWRPGRANACAEGPDGRGFDLRALWEAFFQDLPPGGRVLDLATGSGEVAFYAAARRATPPLEVHGVDLAEVHPVTPQGATPISPIAFQGGVALEALPFEAAAFDAVVSQFGFEYAEGAGAAREAARVLKPGGRGLFVIHHRSSAITAESAARLKAHEAAIGDGRLVKRLRKVFDIYAQPAGPGPGLAEARARLRDALDGALKAQGADWPDPLLAYLRALAANPEQFDPRDALSRLDVFEEEALAWTLRQRAQGAAALDQAGVDRLIHRLSRADVAARARPLEQGGRLVAWEVRLEKAG